MLQKVYSKIIWPVQEQAKKTTFEETCQYIFGIDNDIKLTLEIRLK